MEISIKIQKCKECLKCKILPDPDPYDWFCDNDVKMKCLQANKEIAGALRPHETDSVEIPYWCPLK